MAQFITQERLDNAVYPKYTLLNLCTIMTWGKYKGYSIQDIIECDIKYAEWLIYNYPSYWASAEVKQYYNSYKELAR